MPIQGKTRIAIGLVAAIVTAGYLVIESGAPMVTAGAEEPAKTVRNTGSPAGPGFLVDFTKRQDRDTYYPSDHNMDEEWIKIVFKTSNIDFSKDGMTLSLLKTLGGKFPISGAEFQRTGTYGYGRYEAVLTAADGHGAIASFFTYTGDHFGDPHDEIDFEFVAMRPRDVHLNYFKNGENTPLYVPLWFDTTQADHLYAFEWAPDSIRWYVDGVKVHEVRASDGAKIPSASGRVILNIWAGAGSATSWTGEPRFTVTEAKYRCMSHVPAGKRGPQCSDIFKAPPKPLASN
ncbi:MAG: family 16 glycosylhydrolase [Hyphomonadaceae bacterium]|nr:family 16 glycosylhydrolase [Hyphomonadaceae bacterium]